MNFLAQLYQHIYRILQHPCLQRLLPRILPYRLWIIVPLHLLLFTLSYLFGLVLIYGWEALSAVLFETLPWTLLPLIAIRTAVFYHYDLFQGHWRYVSFEDLINITRAVTISSMLFFGLGMVWERAAVADRLCLLEMILCIVLVGGVRFVVRNFRENVFQARPPSSLQRILLAGPLRCVQPLAKELTGDPDNPYYPTAIVDPERTARHEVTRVSDIAVYPINYLPYDKPGFKGLKAVVICWPGANRSQLNRLVDALEPLQLPYKIVPQMEEILSDKVRVSDIREVEIDDLLERPPVHIDMEKLRGVIEGKVVMVSGGGGSIGSELCRQIACFRPGRLLVVERSENSLYEFQLELKQRFPALKFYASISSVNDGPGLTQLMKKLKVDLVFHAAAYKHVPLMEAAPVESAYNNILGTYNAARAALAAGAERFVMISTDKAVNPTNVMGVTKRIAEMVVQSFNGQGRTRFVTVRFGNVLGSAGSVIPIFKKQIAAGGPLTVTHADIERYFMTIPEATQLVLQAGCIESAGEIFVLDMGRPVKILKLAEKLVTLSGKRPYDDIDIQFTGLRPGEKMYEELFNKGERLMETAHPRIRAAVSAVVDRQDMEAEIVAIRELVARHDAGRLIAKFRELVPAYPGRKAPQVAIVDSASEPRRTSRPLEGVLVHGAAD
jgi:FlaA1/EpsC-like NDP-sugar epimerase